MAFGSIFGRDTQSNARNLGELLVDAVEGAGNMAVSTVDTVLSAAVTYGPGLAAKGVEAGVSLVSGVEEAGRSAAAGVAEAISPSAAAKDFSSMLAGVNLGLEWNQPQSAQLASLDMEPAHGLGGRGAGYGQSSGFGLSV